MSTSARAGVAATLTRNARFIRPALIALIAVDILALAAFSVRLESVTTTTVTPGSPAPVSALPVQPSTQLPLPPAAVPAVVLPGTPTTGSTAEPTTDEPAKPPVKTTDPEPTGPTEPTVPGSVGRIARCTIPLKEPTTSGGLQTLIGFAPAFGPFKDEAFAAASAYQPVLQLLGPILAKYPQIAPKIEPAMAPFLDAFAGVLNQTFALIAPYYTPFRQDVLEAEAKLAAALGPYAQTLATSPLGGCIVELQAVLLEDSKAPAAAKK